MGVVYVCVTNVRAKHITPRKQRIIEYHITKQSNTYTIWSVSYVCQGMVFVQGVVIRSAKSADELNDIYKQGLKARHTGATNINEHR